MLDAEQIEGWCRMFTDIQTTVLRENGEQGATEPVDGLALGSVPCEEDER